MQIYCIQAFDIKIKKKEKFMYSLLLFSKQVCVISYTPNKLEKSELYIIINLKHEYVF